MELVDADITEDPGYVSCMFCTARCFKLHGGHGVKGGSKGCGAAAPSSHSPAQEAAPHAGVKGIGTSHKHRAPFFVKTVKVTTVRRKNCELHLPAFFFKDYGDRFQKFVLLQGPGGQVWPVNLCVSCGSTTGRPTVRFSRGWKEFAADHHLELGDKLIFTLVSFSRFSVQVFDPLGKKKPTSTKAVSGWSFRREESVDGETPQQKKSIFVNWQNKVVRQAALGSGTERSKKTKAVENGQTKMPMLYRHLKRENNKLENRNAVVAKFRARKPDKSLPLSLLGQEWSKQSGSTSSSDSEEEFVDFNGGNGGETDLLLEWEPLENTSPLQTWPLALSSNDSSKALVTTQQPISAGTSKNKPMNLSIASAPDPPPASNPHVLENREQGKCRSNFPDQQEEEDPLQAYWKLNERSSNSAAWSTDDMHRNVKPTPNAHVLNVRPISALESPQEVDAVYTPSSPTLSLSHYLEASSPEAVQSHHGQESRLLASQSQQRFKFPDQWTALRKHMEKRGGGCADSPVLGSEDLPPRSCHAQSITQVRGIADSSRQSSVRMEESTHWNRSLPDDNRAHSAKSANEFNPIRVSESNVPRQTVDCDSQLGIHNPSRTPQNFSNSMPTRSDLSLSYFLNQPRPTARRQNHEEEGANAGHQSVGGKFTNAKGTSGSEIDRVLASGGSSLQKRQKSAVVTDEMPGGAVSGRTCLDVRASDKVQGCVGEQTRGVITAGLTSARQMQCPAERLAFKTARCYVDEDFNIRTTSPGSREIPAASPASAGPLVVSKPLERDVSFSDEQDQLHQKELELTCKRSDRDDLKSPTKRIRSKEEDGDFDIRTTSQESREIQAANPASAGPLVVSKPLERDVSFSDEQDQLHQKELTLTCKRSGNPSEKDDLNYPTKRFRSEKTAAEVLTERNPNHQKIPTPNLCTISPPTNDHKPAPACRKEFGITEYLEQKRVARKTRPRLKKRAGLLGAGAGAVAVLQKAGSIAEDIKPLVNASSNSLVGATSKTIRSQTIVSNSRASAPRDELKVRKLGGAFNLTERTPITHMRKRSGNRCDLVELEGIASEEDEPAGGDLFEVEESWDTWMEIIRQRDNATSSHHLRTPLRLKPR